MLAPGVRVVRGPDWNWTNRDGGEGHVGTVCGIGRCGSLHSPEKTVVVNWDSGNLTNYRAGYQGKYDLTIVDNAQIGVKHPNIMCDGCLAGVDGIRFLCAQCANYDLCATCYGNDIHDLDHPFIRYQTTNSVGVRVPSRQSSIKIQLKGIFVGAKVVRWPDREWGKQDGGEGKTGLVMEIRGWISESCRSVAIVSWVTGSTNAHRIGHKGNVDLKYIQPAVGGYYYRDHMPVLGQTEKQQPVVQATIPTYSVEDGVRVCLDKDTLMKLQQGHGGWNPQMTEYLSKIGIVHRITGKGDIRVQYEGCANRWTFHPAALVKVRTFHVGDLVTIINDAAKVQQLQRGHGEWVETMRNALNKSAKVIMVYDDGDLRIQQIEDGFAWILHPKCVKLERSPLATATKRSNSMMDLSHQRADHVMMRLSGLSESSSAGKLSRVAVHQGHIQLVNYLLTLGANINVVDKKGDATLHYAAFDNQPQIMQVLLMHGANINVLNSSHCSALHISAHKKLPHCVRITVRNNRGFCALHHASLKGNSNAIKRILQLARQLVDVKKDDGISAGWEEVPCERFKKDLIRRIMGLDVDVSLHFSNELDKENDENKEEVEYEIHRHKEHDEYIHSFVSDNSSSSNVIKNIKEQASIDAETNDTGNRDNLMYNVPFAKYFSELSKTFLLIWSAVNCQFFELSDERASTANCESYFKDNKLSHKSIIPCRVDTFVSEDIKMIDGCVIEASQKYIKYIDERNITNSDTIENVSIEEIPVQDSFGAQSTTAQYVESDAEKESIIIDSSTLHLYSLYHPQPSLENDQSGVDVSTGELTESVDIQLAGCVACNNKHFPSGAHSCYKCGKNVYVLNGCSNSVQDEEGYGEKRVCTSCSIELSSVRTRKRPFSSDNFATDLANELNNKEKSVKLGMLSNGNLSKSTYIVNRKTVALRNTCAFDSTAQILAGAYAYFEPYRCVADNSKDKIFAIAISLAKNENLRKANEMRATLMYNLFEISDCNMVVTDLICKALKCTPSYTEYQKCSRNRCTYSREEMFPLLGVCTDILDNNFKNLRSAVIENFPEVGMKNFPEPKCKICNFRISTTRSFGDHLFIEVPVTTYNEQHSNDFEFTNEVNLKTLPLSLELGQKRYILFGLVLFHPPLIEGHSGHYVSAVRINNSWQVYDDVKTKPYNIKNDDDIVIHLLFYIAIESKM